ncbi:MAG: esterase-like activity of phytase family protein [Micropepsaceae bacterium]
MKRSAIALGLAASLSAAYVFYATAEPRDARALSLQVSGLPFSTGEDAKSYVGKLRHRGTLKLTSDDADFGGLSGLIVSDDGARFLAITDNSNWLTGTLTYRDGKLAGLNGTSIAPLLDLKGRKLSGKDGDAEGLAGSLDGDVFVSFERDHRIWRYAFGKDGLAAKGVAVATPAALKDVPNNKGLEGIALLSDGRLLALTEAYHDDAGNIRGWLLKDGAEAQAITLARRAPFDLTDVRQLPNGDVLTLERRFNRTGGVGFEMRRIKGADIAAAATLDGEVAADVGMNFIIDNMEGLSVRNGDNGETLVYVVSDDNFNAPVQQTLLMMFELKD